MKPKLAFTPLTDEQFVERVRRWQRYRRPVGAACLLIGIAAAALVLYWVHDLRAQSLALLSQFDPSRAPTTQQVQQSFQQAQFNVGFGLGFGLAAGLMAGTSLAAYGVLWLVTHDRKDRLLLRCWDAEPTTP